MNTDIEWLFAEVYNIKTENPTAELCFLSDWDCDVEQDDVFSSLLKNAYHDAAAVPYKYTFSYEQFSLKNNIISCFRELYQFELPISSLTIAPSSTQGIYLALKALKKLNFNRYLVFTPTYFSTLDTLTENGSHVYYFHLVCDDKFSIDYLKLERIFHEQFIDCLILTDPIFSSGVEFTIIDYERMGALCKKYKVCFFVDYSLGGLSWDTNQLKMLNYQKVSELTKLDQFIFIDSLSKRLQLNGIKFSILIGSDDLIDQIDTISEAIYGGLNNITVSVMQRMYDIHNVHTVLNMHKMQIRNIADTYRLIQTTLLGEPYSMPDSNSGYFSLIYHDSKSFNDIDTKAITLELLKKDHIIAIPNNRFSYFETNKFGWRINLTKNPTDILAALRKCIRKVLS